MKLSTRGQYGTRALLDLALHDGQKLVLVKDIAARQQISPRYLEHLITRLIAGGLVRSTRGPKGGVILARPPEEIELSEVIQLLEGPIALVECINDPDICSRNGFCVTRDIWAELGEAINKILKSTTIQDLVERQKNKQLSETTMYYI
jgi:Rrf2 family protein